MAFFVIILGDPFTNFDCRGANDGIEISVVVGRASEDFDAQRSFLERLGMTVQRALYYETQQIREALALAEQRAR